MANLSELELQNLRHLIGGYDTTKCKMQDYASATQDPKLRQFFEKRRTEQGTAYAVLKLTKHKEGGALCRTKQW